MSIFVFWLLAAIAAVPIGLPLFRSRRESNATAFSSDREIERAVRALRQARGKAGPRCPACGEAYEPGDRYCVYCGGDLPQAGAPALCAHCQAPLRPEDRFCSQCAQPVSGREAN